MVRGDVRVEGILVRRAGEGVKGVGLLAGFTERWVLMERIGWLLGRCDRYRREKLMLYPLAVTD